MNLVGSIQTLGENALTSAGSETLAVYDAIAQVAAQLSSTMTGEQAFAMAEIARRAERIASALRGTETMDMEFLKLLKGDGQ